METPNQLFDTRSNVFLRDTTPPFPVAFATKPLNVVDRWEGGQWTGIKTQLAARSWVPILQVAATAQRGKYPTPHTLASFADSMFAFMPWRS